MSAKSNLKHLESITVEGLLRTKEDGFVLMASSTGTVNGYISLGVSCFGMFVVMQQKGGSKVKWEFKTPELAIHKYGKMLTDGE